MIASGAKREKINNPNYYNNLLNYYPKVPVSPPFESIKLDIHRTFPDMDFYKQEENLIKLENILKAFAMRNPSIGYCQGFNYLVAKLLYFMKNEEDVFWLFTVICENYLPFDFYITFCGVRTDMEILKKIIKKTITDIDVNSELCITNLITKCLISIFSQNVNNKILYTIWDHLFIYGNTILYRAFIWCIYLLYDKDLRQQPIDKLHSILSEKLLAEEDLGTLCFFLTKYNRVGEDFIEFNRKKISKKTMKESVFEDPDVRESKVKNCDTRLPFCLCAKGLRGDEETICLRCAKSSFFIIDNYFFTNIKYPNEKDEITVDDLLIERQRHVCGNTLYDV
ncbi:MAG: TBC domain-containing protein [archaeon]|nr:TBC domain-containing protein [archaeon]